MEWGGMAGAPRAVSGGAVYDHTDPRGLLSSGCGAAPPPGRLFVHTAAGSDGEPESKKPRIDNPADDLLPLMPTEQEEAVRKQRQAAEEANSDARAQATQQDAVPLEKDILNSIRKQLQVCTPMKREK